MRQRRLRLRLRLTEAGCDLVAAEEDLGVLWRVLLVGGARCVVRVLRGRVGGVQR